jgi:phage baseplate assembly protein gpV
VKSPWVPYAQIAGDLKFHQPPSVGQVMSLRSENGDIEQGVLDPYHFSDDNPSPSADANSNVLTFGSVKVTLGQSSIEVDIGGTVYTFAAAGFDQTGGYQKHNGTHVDDTHVHGGVIPGGADTEPPAN